ncbi:S9 family peptidase [Halomonas denitrificans]|nr:S9 family peptidase [Halomonas denitrificans]
MARHPRRHTSAVRPSETRHETGYLARLLLIAATASIVACSGSDSDFRSSPPAAEREAHVVRAPGGDRSDPYYWIRDDRRQDARVLELIRAENAHTARALARLAPLVGTLETELANRVPAEHREAPFHRDGYWYYTRYAPGADHPVLARRRGSLAAPEEILLDGHRLARAHSQFRLAGWDISPDGTRLLWLEGTRTGRQFRLRIRDLETGELHDPGIDGISSASWSPDGRTILMVENDPQTLRAFRVRRLDPGPGRVSTVYTEADTAFRATVGRSRSGRYNLVELESTDSSELRFIDGSASDAELRVFLSRSPGHRYQADHVGDHWFIRTNRDAPNFRIMRAGPDGHDRPSSWTELVGHRDQVFIAEFDPFETFLAFAERSDGQRRIRVLDFAGQGDRRIEFDEDVHVVQLGRNPDPTRRRVQYVYTSPTTPQTTWELDLDSGVRRLINRFDVGGGFDSGDYRVRRLWATARDGTAIPVSLAWHEDTPLDGTAPLLQTAYGAYGRSEEPGFSAERLSLLDRGMVFAIAHVRGGQELGRDWYEQGRLLNKRNSFTDFIDVTRHLVDERLVDADRVFASGASAGGLLVAAVANMAPDRYAGIVAAVPFVDVVTTMLDESIPLTSFEFSEWGDPRQPEVYRYMLSYSPYDNVQRRDYPPMLVTAGLWDSQVQYWEPVKWVARLRHRKTDANPLLLAVDLEAGHGGRSGRYGRLETRAKEYAFVLDLAGLGE